MLSRNLLWTIGLGILGIIVVSWWIESIPGRVTIVNQSGVSLSDVSLASGAQTIDLGVVRNGESRSVSLQPGMEVELRYRRQSVVRWRSPRPLASGRPMVLYVTPGDRIDVRDRIGTFSR